MAGRLEGPSSSVNMVKIFFVCRRRAGLAVEDYRRMVLEEHVPLALEHHRTMRRYEINLVQAVPAGAPETVSIAVLCFNSLADYQQRLYDSKTSRTIIETDAARFMGGADAYLTEETVLVEGPPRGPLGEPAAGNKTMVLLKLGRQTGPDVLTERLLGLADGKCRLVLNPVRERLSESGPDWQAFVELHRNLGAGEAGALLGDTATGLVCYPVDEYVEK